jgi:hypothetical protein
MAVTVLLLGWSERVDLTNWLTGFCETGKKPTVEGHEVPMRYGVALAFVALDDCSPYHMNPDAPNSALLNLTLALAKVHDRMQPRMLGVVDMIDKK